eukprot:1875001-Prymnesium_polylepis.2
MDHSYLLMPTFQHDVQKRASQKSVSKGRDGERLLAEPGAIDDELGVEHTPHVIFSRVFLPQPDALLVLPRSGALDTVRQGSQ